MSETQTLTLTGFLFARIAEDERAASKAGSFTPWSETFQNDNYGHLTVQPDRVLAECEAKRRIVELASPAIFDGKAEPGGGLPDVLALLALPYADHPDFREEWRARD